MAFNVDEINDDHRQHINLSAHAWSVISDDIIYLEGPEASNVSGILNRIFNNYKDVSNASIGITLDKLSDYYYNLFDGITGIPVESTSKLINTLIEDKKRELLDNVDKLVKSKALKFRINNDNFTYLTDDFSECVEDEYYPSIGKYLKAIFEDYTNLAFVERERILFKDTIRVLLKAIEENQLLRLKTISGSTLEIKPHSIRTDALATFNYVVCYSRKISDNVEEDFRPASIRLARIDASNIRPIKSRSGKITKSERLSLEEKVSAQGPNFMIDKEQEFRVRLTDKGIKSYYSLINLRPQFIKREGNEFLFKSTEFHIRTYFFIFGADALVLEPKTLRDSMLLEYSAAKDRYDED
ncbi:MAG: WYL domain-containing protein [Clostridiales Family XIII bacterium]|jgi:hypothetical protein|nr:WYL domain-containing protein [Clostridiales Family XIII bacterium]